MNKYTLLSFPLSSLSKFFWCVIKINKQTQIPYSTSDLTEECRTNTIPIGNVKPAHIELKETYFVANKTVTKTRTQSRAADGLTANTIPNNVATPLPPLKPANMGNKCPITAITPKANW